MGKNPQVFSDSSWEWRSQFIALQPQVSNLNIIPHAKEMKELFSKIRGQESLQLSLRMNLGMIGYTIIYNNNNKGSGRTSQKMTTGS